MLPILDEFREKLSNAMLPAIHRRIILYGFGFTGRFLKWYAEYYHSIKIDYIIQPDMEGAGGKGHNWEEEIFPVTLMEFDFKDTKSCVIWLAEPLEDMADQLDLWGNDYIDFYKLIYGDDVLWPDNKTNDAFQRRKSGKKDIQFLEWLEWKHVCNFVTAIDKCNLVEVGDHGASYRCFTQKEIFPILDKCHVVPRENDAIFDFGCGKGGAMVSFADYGFLTIGGVEYESGIYEILMDNMDKLGMKEYADLECIHGNAALVKEPLDRYNYFWFFSPFDEVIFNSCAKNIYESLQRCPRKAYIIVINPYLGYRTALDEAGIWNLTNQFTIATRQRVVSVWTN